MIGAPVVAALGHVFLSDRLGLPAGTASGLAIAAGAAWAILGGAAASVAGRRIAFYELVAATLLLLALALGPLTFFLPALRGLPLVLHSWQYQGRVVLTAGLLLVCLSTGALGFLGSTLAFLLTGSGRVDPSMGWELFVARSHLRLHARTLGALFLIVVTGVIPGLLAGIAWSAWQDRKARRAALSGEPHERPRLPATMLMTLISIGGVATGVWALTVVLSVMSGFEQDLKSKILGAHAHGVVLKYGQNDFTDWRGTQERVLSVPGRGRLDPVPLRRGDALRRPEPDRLDPEGGRHLHAGEGHRDPAQPGGGKARVAGPARGDPAGEAAPGAGRGAGGRRLEPAGAARAAPAAAPGERLPGILLGRELARGLRVGVGDVVNVVSPFGDIGPAGPQPKSRPFRVAGLLYSGFYEYDAKFAYLQLAEAQRFFGSGDSVTGLELKVKDVNAARPVMRKVLAALEGYPFRTKDWGEMNRNLFSALMMERIAMAVILGFIMLVASFIVVATLVMLVLEKTREIAVLRSMGATTTSIMKIFVAEGLAIGAVGTGFGLLLGLGTTALVSRVGIPLDPEVYYISHLPVLVDGGDFALVALAAIALSYLATIYPATRAARLEPVEGLRGE